MSQGRKFLRDWHFVVSEQDFMQMLPGLSESVRSRVFVMDPKLLSYVPVAWREQQEERMELFEAIVCSLFTSDEFH